MLNINDNKFEDKGQKPIFNNGKAGVARNCTGKITKRGADDPENSPKYKLYWTDENGAEVNKGLFELNEKSSDGAKQYFVKEMKHIMSQCEQNWDRVEWDENNLNEMLDYVMKKCKDAFAENKWGVGVSFGTVDRPDRFLKVNGFWEYRNEKNISDAQPLTLSKKSQIQPIEPTEPKVNNDGDWDVESKTTDKNSDDMPF